MNDKYKIQFHEPLKYLALTDKNKQDLKNSSSGGAFMVFARPFIEQGGVVFGCKLEDSGKCYQTFTTTYKGLKDFQGSKYVRSKISKSYEQCCNFLKNNKMVLYSGTPCQIAGLYAYLNKQNATDFLDNLLTVDLFCHGTPTQNFFILYLKWLSKKYKTNNILNYKFRTKKYCWRSDINSFEYIKKDKKRIKYLKSFSNVYFEAFLKNICLQEQCYTCKYSQKFRVSDISIGDFWTIKNAHPKFYSKFHKAGISAVFLNSKNAIKFFDLYCKDNADYLESSYEKMKQASIDKSNVSVEQDGIINKSKRDKIKIAIKNQNYDLLFNNICKLSNTKKIHKILTSTILKIMPKKLKKLLRKILLREKFL